MQFYDHQVYIIVHSNSYIDLRDTASCVTLERMLTIGQRQQQVKISCSVDLICIVKISMEKMLPR